MLKFDSNKKTSGLTSGNPWSALRSTAQIGAHVRSRTRSRRGQQTKSQTKTSWIILVLSNDQKNVIHVFRCISVRLKCGLKKFIQLVEFILTGRLLAQVPHYTMMQNGTTLRFTSAPSSQHLFESNLTQATLVILTLFTFLNVYLSSIVTMPMRKP